MVATKEEASENKLLGKSQKQRVKGHRRKPNQRQRTGKTGMVCRAAMAWPSPIEATQSGLFSYRINPFNSKITLLIILGVCFPDFE
jgi:hypothetical protein